MARRRWTDAAKSWCAMSACHVSMPCQRTSIPSGCTLRSPFLYWPALVSYPMPRRAMGDRPGKVRVGFAVHSSPLPQACCATNCGQRQRPISQGIEPRTTAAKGALSCPIDGVRAQARREQDKTHKVRAKQLPLERVMSAGAAAAAGYEDESAIAADVRALLLRCLPPGPTPPAGSKPVL